MDHPISPTERISVKFAIIFLLIGSFLLFFTNLGGRDFWAPDEGDFAQIVKELDTDPIVPHLNNVPYGEKPPLFYYIVFAFAKTFRFLPEESSMRLSSAFAALITIIAFFLVTRKTFGFSQSLASVIVLGLTPLFYWQARYLQVDMVFSAALVLALLAFFRFMENGRTGWYYAFFIMLAFAFMAKGPLAGALAVPVVIIYCISEKRIAALLTRHTVFGILVFLAIIVPWYCAVYLKEGYPYLYENILRQNFLRFFEAWSHKRPFYYYFTTLPLDFFPWSLFLPLGLYTAFKTWKTDKKVRFFLLWFLWFFLFFSLSSGKISKYMLPALPALAVIVSNSMREWDRLYNKIAFSILAAVFCCLGIVLFVYNFPQYPEFRPERIILGTLAICSGICIFACVKFSAARKAFACIAIFLGLAYITGNVTVFEKLNRYKSPKPVSEKIRALAGDTIPWVYYGSMRGVYVYYVGRFAVHIEENDGERLREFAGNESEFYLLTRKRDADQVKDAAPGAVISSQETIGNTPMVIFHYTKKGNG
ncbi:MAG: arnT 1 [Deltaproteobacteria bacterium]|nr:arnT 1 [Deltaproteobacteria bacterium]